jgi:hypothetical protein
MEEAKQRSRSVIESAKMFGPPSWQLHEDLRSVIDDMGKAPMWVRQRVRGYQEALTDALYQTSLVYGVMTPEGFLSTDRERSDYYEKKGIDAKEFGEIVLNSPEKAGHYWVTGCIINIRSNPAGNLKPFFTGEPRK